MRDIGRIEERLTNVERVTTLSLLEKDAQSFETTDANGLNRFKSGFVVDNFTGHKIGDTLNPDYRNSMDTHQGELRPVHKTKGVDLIEQATTDAARTAPVIKRRVISLHFPTQKKFLRNNRLRQLLKE